MNERMNEMQDTWRCEFVHVNAGGGTDELWSVVVLVLDVDRHGQVVRVLEGK